MLFSDRLKRQKSRPWGPRAMFDDARRSSGLRSAAGDAHVPLNRRARGLNMELVSLRLAG
jgi:hypothetical protein